MDDIEVTDKNFFNICRLCAEEGGVFLDIFQSTAEILYRIHKYLPIKVEEHDPLPKKICHKCMYRLKDFDEFNRRCMRVEVLFKNKVADRLKRKIETENQSRVTYPRPLPRISNLMIENGNLSEVTYSAPESRTPDSMIENGNLSEVTYSAPESRTPDSMIENGNQSEVTSPFPQSTTSDSGKPHSTSTMENSETTNEVSSSVEERVDTIQDVNVKKVESENLHQEVKKTKKTAIKKQKNPKSDDDMEVNQSCESDSDKSEKSLDLSRFHVTNIPGTGFIYMCSTCQHIYLSKEKAMDHICNKSTGSPDKKNKSPSKKSYECGVCNQKFSRIAKLHSHLETHMKPSSPSGEEQDSNSESDFPDYVKGKGKRVKKRMKYELSAAEAWLPTEGRRLREIDTDTPTRRSTRKRNHSAEKQSMDHNFSDYCSDDE